MRKISYFGIIFLIFSCPFLLFAAGNTVFGPVQLTINAWHTHFSSHKFEVTDPQKGILSLKNNSADKKVNGGLVWFNGALISVDLKKNPVFEKEVDLKKSNYLIVFLEGKPKASATLEIRTKDVTPPPEAEFKAEPASIRPGQTSTLSWTTQNANTVSIDQGIGSVALNGSLNVTPLVNTAYTLTAQGPGGTVTKTATVLVVNQAPVAYPQSLSLNEDSNLAITLTGSDTDNDPLTYVITTSPTHGTLTGTTPNVIYTPSSGFYGTDSFTFKVNDGYVDSTPATISLAINHVNHPPKANAQALTLNQDSSLAITLTGSDIDNDPFTYQIVTNPAHGTLTGTAPNLTYTPSSAFYGADIFTFKVNDGYVDSATATISLTINHVNHAPVANGQTLNLNEDSNIPITLTGSDADNDPLTYVIVTNPIHGSLTGTAPNLTYTPTPLYHGTDSFSFKVNDGFVDSAPATINLTISHVNHAPVANGQALSLNEDSNLAITLTGSDADNDPLTYVIVTNPIHGSLTGTAPNLTYTPTPLYHGTDSFTFKVNDGFVDSAPAVINLTINHVNHAPMAADDTAQTNAGQPVSINVLANDTDPDNDTLGIQNFTQPANGTAVNNNNGSFTYTPKANFSGSDSFNYTITDGQGGTATAKVTILVKDPNAPPTASLSASPQTISKGGSTTLTWSSNKASQAHLDNGLGNVALIGSQLVTPEHTTTYTLTVTGPTGVASASVIVTVLGNPLPQPDGSFGQKYEDLTPPDATIE